MFEHLKKLEVKDKTAKFALSMLQGEPQLIVRPATESNKGYFNEILRRSAKTIRNVATGRRSTITSETLEKNRADDRNLFPKHIIVGWEGVRDSDGKEVEFTQENCKEFLVALPDWIFDQIGIFCRNNSNFADLDIDPEEVDGLAKN